MNLDKIKKILKEDMPEERVFLFYGDEVFLKNHYREQLMKKLADSVMPDMNNFYFEEKGYSLEAVDSAIDTLPFMSDRKLLYFKNSYIFKPDSRTGAKQEYRDFWEKRLKSVPEGVYIIFDEAEVDKRSGLYKRVSKDYTATEFAYLGEQEMINWTVGLFKSMGKTISPHDAEYLIGICSGGMTAVKNEAVKLSASTGGGVSVGMSDIKTLVTPTVENKIFEMLDAVIAKNADLALTKLADLFYLKESEVKILSIIAGSADKLINTKIAVENGKGQAEIMLLLDFKSPFIAKKYISDCRKYSYEDLVKLISVCASTDALLKSNSIDKRTLIELLVAEVIGS